jgi:hypothetical protein
MKCMHLCTEIAVDKTTHRSCSEVSSGNGRPFNCTALSVHLWLYCSCIKFWDSKLHSYVLLYAWVWFTCLGFQLHLHSTLILLQRLGTQPFKLNKVETLKSWYVGLRTFGSMINQCNKIKGNDENVILKINISSPRERVLFKNERRVIKVFTLAHFVK